MRVSDQLRGLVRADIMGAFPESFLNAAAAAGIELWELAGTGETASPSPAMRALCRSCKRLRNAVAVR